MNDICMLYIVRVLITMIQHVVYLAHISCVSSHPCMHALDGLRERKKTCADDRFLSHLIY